ncbi:MAG TPA: phage head-tail connector protein [Vicinamibacterales bacterium]|nr:phage head-tail connector protein [Vicinamibacterales bacterium]
MAVLLRGGRSGTAWPRVTRTVVTAAVLDPFSLAEAKAQSRIDLAEEDALLEDYLKAATRRVETDTGMALLTQTVDLTFDGLPQGWGVLDLPIGPVQSITSVTYIDTSAVSQTMASGDRLLSGSRIGLIDTASWPTDIRGFAPVTVRVVAGYTTAALIPADLRMAVRLVFGWLVAHREPDEFDLDVYEGWIRGYRRVLIA